MSNTIILSFFNFILGLIIGSFLNVCISRIPNKESIVFPNSHCPKCGKNIKAYDLIPVISYIILRGRCRYCSERISVQYPIVELLTGIVFVLLYLKLGLTIELIKFSIIACILIVVSVIDFKTQEIPDELIIFGSIAGLLFIFISDFRSSIISGALGFIIGGGLFLLIAIVSKGSMGGGDIKLMAMLGLWFGWRLILVIALLSFFIGSVISIGLMITKIKGRKDYIPFGPFIALAAFIIIIYGNEILKWYINTLIG